MRDFRSTRGERIMYEVRYWRGYWPEAVAGVMLVAFVLVIAPILAAML